MSRLQKKKNKNTIYSSKNNTPYGIHRVDAAGQRKRLKEEKRQRKQQQTKIIKIIIIVLTVILAAAFLTRKNAVDVYAGDNYVGMLKGTKITAEDFKNSVTASIASEAGTNVLINEEIRFEKTRLKKKDVVTVEYALSEIKRLVTYKVEATVITVDSGEIIALSKAEEAQNLLNSIIEEYIPANSNIVESGFVENVQTITKFVESTEIATEEEAEKRLTQGTSATKTYTVATGDTFSKIASKNGITIEEIMEANPSLNVNTVLRVGDKINLKVMVPFISVKTVENVVFTEKQEKIVEYRKDETKPVTYKKVVQQGKDGQKEVTTQIIRINGFETEQRAASEKITVEPVTEIIVVGTK